MGAVIFYLNYPHFESRRRYKYSFLLCYVIFDGITCNSDCFIIRTSPSNAKVDVYLLCCNKTRMISWQWRIKFVHVRPLFLNPHLQAWTAHERNKYVNGVDSASASCSSPGPSKLQCTLYYRLAFIQAPCNRHFKPQPPTDNMFLLLCAAGLNKSLFMWSGSASTLVEVPRGQRHQLEDYTRTIWCVFYVIATLGQLYHIFLQVIKRRNFATGMRI